MLTVKTITNVVSHNLKIHGSSDPTEILSGKENEYFYIKRSGSVGSSKGSVFFSLAKSTLDLIPSNAIINNISIIFNTEKTNSVGTYDGVALKINGTTLANIDATLHTPNKIQSTTFQADQLFDEDIFKSALEKYIFEISLTTEGSNEFRLHSINFSITYTEMIATSICKMMTKDGLITIPLYNPLSLSRYAMRIITKTGPKSFDLIDIEDPAASPIRVMTPYGLKAVRMSITPPIINIFDPTAEKLQGYYFAERTGSLVARPGDIIKDIACVEYIEVESSGVYDIYCASTPLSVVITVVEYDESQNVIKMYDSINSIRIPMSNTTRTIRVCITSENDQFDFQQLLDAYNSLVIAIV